MILPIYLFGQPVLRKEAEEVPADYPELGTLVENMYLTMEKANGVGLAAPQVGLALRMFVVDGNGLAEDYPECTGVRRCMINPEIVEQSDETNMKEEGCLSIPGIYESVKRPNWVVVNYLDEKFEEHEERLEGFAARMVLHEYDHLDGKMFVDHVSPLRKTFIKSKLTAIMKGKNNPSYKFRGVK